MRNPCQFSAPGDMDARTFQARRSAIKMYSNTHTSQINFSCCLRYNAKVRAKGHARPLQETHGGGGGSHPKAVVVLALDSIIPIAACAHAIRSWVQQRRRPFFFIQMCVNSCGKIQLRSPPPEKHRCHHRAYVACNQVLATRRWQQRQLACSVSRGRGRTTTSHSRSDTDRQHSASSERLCLLRNILPAAQQNTECFPP